LQEAALDKVKQELKRNRELIDNDGELPQEDELYTELAKAANILTAKDYLIQVSVTSLNFPSFLFSLYNI